MAANLKVLNFVSNGNYSSLLPIVLRKKITMNEYILQWLQWLLEASPSFLCVKKQIEKRNQFLTIFINTQNMTNQTIVSTVKMEYG